MIEGIMMVVGLVRCLMLVCRTHVYVQQANSVFAGVSHPKAEAHPEHTHHDHSVKEACERAACSDPVEVATGMGGGPAPFSEIEVTNCESTSRRTHYTMPSSPSPKTLVQLVQSTPSLAAPTAPLVQLSVQWITYYHQCDDSG